MKILSKKKYIELGSYKGKVKNLEVIIESLNKHIDEQTIRETVIIEELYNIKNMLKQPISKTTVKKRVDKLIKLMGGR